MILTLVIIFIAGYLLIALESYIKINKAASALITGVLCWMVLIISSEDQNYVAHQLSDHLGDITGILFFLLGAMTIVELIDAHDGFEIIIRKITTDNKTKLLWIISFITFFLSAVLDNLTTTIVIVTLLRKLINDDKERIWFASMVVIAANAGGAWSPIGDITTTMLWIGGQITPAGIIRELIVPSIVCLLIPLIIISKRTKGNLGSNSVKEIKSITSVQSRHQSIILFSGIAVLILVPVFKSITHLPPFMGVLLGLGILWIITEVLHAKKIFEERQKLSVAHALQRIDTPSILFFLGILIAVASLEASSVLTHFAGWIDTIISSDNELALLLGFLSSIVDNIPLVAAAQGMYSLDQYPVDHHFWEFLAYSVGNGGSILIIGSAAGIVAMGMENIKFFWYLKNVSIIAIAGLLGGAFIYILF